MFFISIWDKARSFDAGAGKPFNWAVKITRNKSIDRLRARRRLRVLEEAIDNAPVAGNGCETQKNEDYRPDYAEQIRAAVNELPFDQRRAIELAFFCGFTHIEVAVALQKPIGTIKARIRRGILRLRKGLKRDSNQWKEL
jgi:RNA polymerase sigma-70 factor, ECF subfamily